MKFINMYEIAKKKSIKVDPTGIYHTLLFVGKGEKVVSKFGAQSTR